MAGRSEKRGNSDRENPESRQISPLGRAIRWFREDQGLSQENLAELAKIDKQRIADVERGETQSLHSPTLKALANGLGISTAELRAKAQEFREADKAEATTEAPSRAPAPLILHPDIRHVPGFVGREDLLAGIDDALWRKGGTAALTNDTASAAVKGLGGVGKSVLAREWAWQNRGKYHGVWWVRAETEQTLIDDLIDLGSRLIPNLKEVPERDRALHLALDAIAGSGTADKPWLIIYDNVEKPGAIAKLTPRERAHILITSRWPRWQGHAQELPVDVFPPETAVDFLLAERPHETREAAARLADALGHLPLALSHARAYCAETNLSFDDYARRLSELIQEAPEDAEYPASVFATFSLAIAKAAEACPEAETLMEIAAFLASERIPLDIITEDVMSEKQRERAVAALYRVSLIAHEMLQTGQRAFNVHRLIQEVMESRLADGWREAQQIAIRLIRDALDAFSVHEPVNWTYVTLMLPHATAILDTADELDENEELCKICLLLGRYFEARGDYKTARLFLERAFVRADSTHGFLHPITCACLSELAQAVMRLGQFPEAEQLLIRSLAIAEVTLGPNHAGTASIVHNLAYVYRNLYRYQEAESLCLRALAIAEAEFGPNHPIISDSLDNLASLYTSQERYQEAEPLYIRALAIAESTCGQCHPLTAVRLNNVASLYGHQKRYREAEPLYIRVLAITETVLGPDHPHTGACLNNLARLYQLQDRHFEAEPLYQRGLAILEKKLGPYHPSTQNARSDYESLRQAIAGDL